MASPYPLLISIPHGGNEIPPEVKGKLILQKRDLVEDSDAFTRIIYDIGKSAVKVICADIFRAIVDLNRAPDDLPPANPDGVIKSHTCYNKKIYRGDCHSDTRLINVLLTKYYNDYHNRIQKEIRRDNIEIAFDCHSMASKGPDIAPDSGMDRPVITLGNLHGKACDFSATERLAHAFREEFRLEDYHVKINVPFAGGYITRKYGKKPIPWIQIEMNRCLFMEEQWFNAGTTEINLNRLKVINAKFRKVVERFFGS
jgi:N-formylglutamate deformylase